MKTEKSNGQDGKAVFILSPAQRCFFEQAHNVHRLLVPDGTTKSDIEHPEFLSACRDRVAGGDLAFVFSDNWNWYAQCLAIGAGTQAGSLELGSVRLLMLPGYPIDLPEMDQDSYSGLPSGYRIRFDLARRRHIPLWKTDAEERELYPDGYHMREEARHAILRHSKQAASVRTTAR